MKLLIAAVIIAIALPLVVVAAANHEPRAYVIKCDNTVVSTTATSPGVYVGKEGEATWSEPYGRVTTKVAFGEVCIGIL